MDIISLLLHEEMKKNRRSVCFCSNTWPEFQGGWGENSEGGGGGGGGLLPDLPYLFNRNADDCVDRQLISSLFFFTPLLQKACWGHRLGLAGGRTMNNWDWVRVCTCACTCVRFIHCKQCSGSSLFEWARVDVAVISLVYATDEGPRHLLCLSAAAHVNAQTRQVQYSVLAGGTYREQENIYPPINIFKSIITQDVCQDVGKNLLQSCGISVNFGTYNPDSSLLWGWKRKNIILMCVFMCVCVCIKVCSKLRLYYEASWPPSAPEAGSARLETTGV